MVARKNGGLIGIVPMCAMLLVFWFVPTAARAEDPPKGPYQLNCHGEVMGTLAGGLPFLEAQCLNFYGQYQVTYLNAPYSCPTVDVPGGKQYQIYNLNGALGCNFTPAKQDPNLNWDWVGKTTWTDTAKGIQKTFWAIYQPNVNSPWTDYRQITYMPGDTVNLIAGGCAQIGGHGKTWKRYVDPSGDSSAWPTGEYFGLVQLRGTSAAKFNPPQPPPAIVNVLGQDYTVAEIPLAPTPYFLTLGYVDDGYPNANGYGDNGYYAHDDGDNGQCSSNEPTSLSSGPAWVQFEVDHPLNPTPFQFSAGSKSFDIVFNDLEANGLPLNPEWYWDLHPPADFAPSPNDPLLAEETLHVPDFNVRCGPAFSTPAQYSARNVAGDVASAVSGAATGAEIGSSLGPVGTVVGGAIGAIGGWLFGSDVVASTATTMDQTTLQDKCTSQPVAIDQFDPTSNIGSAVLGVVPGICKASPIRGHLNMQPVTYTGSLHFSDWSGVFPEDNDVNMTLLPGTAGNTGLLWGQTVAGKQQESSKGSEQEGYGGFLIEFDASETVDPYFANRPGGTFWHAFATAAQAAGPNNAALAVTQPPISDFKPSVDAANELIMAASSAEEAESTTNLYVDGVVTGLMGIDGAHSGGIAELHPVFSLAIHQIFRDEFSTTGKTEHWAFFIRNQGDEGNCSDQMHSLEPEQYGTRDYYISLPWPSDPGKPAYNHVSTADGANTIKATPWVSGSSVEGLESTSGVGTYLHFLSPPYSAPAQVPFFGYDGEITLTYTFVGAADMPRDPKSAPRAQGVKEDSARPPDHKDDDKETSSAHDRAEEKKSNDAEDFPWQKLIDTSTDTAVTKHLKKLLLQKKDEQAANPPLPTETRTVKVERVGRKVMRRDARLPHRTHELANPTRQRRNDELSRQTGVARQRFQAVDSQHVFFVGTDGNLHYKEGPFDLPGASADKSADTSKLVDHDVLTFAAFSRSDVLKLTRNGALLDETAPFDVASDGSCAKGYVWRNANSKDHVCVTLSAQQEAAADNAAGPSHALQLSFVKPDTCISGYVWRQANDIDHVCVLPDVRSQTAEDNKNGPSRTSTASLKKFIAWPVLKFQAVSANYRVVLDNNGKLYSVSGPIVALDKPVLIAEKVRAFQAIDPTHTLVLSTDDRLQTYPMPSGGAAPTYSNVWDFQQTSDGSLFVIDADDTLWSEQPLKQLETDVRKMQAIDANTVFVLKADRTLSLRQVTTTQASGQVTAPVASGIWDFQALDAQTVFVLDQDGKLWVIQWNAGTDSARKSLVAEKVR